MFLCKRRQRWADPHGLVVSVSDSVTCCLRRNLSELPKTQLVNVNFTSAEPSLSHEGDRPVCLLLKASKFHWKKGWWVQTSLISHLNLRSHKRGLLVTCFVLHTDTEYTWTDDAYTHTYTNLLKHRSAHVRWHTCMHPRSHNFMKTNKAQPVDRIILKLHDGETLIVPARVYGVFF